MRLLLDTNAYVALMQGHPGVAGCVRLAEHLLISAVVAGELIYGFRNGTRPERNMADFKAFLENPFVEFLPVTLVTADRFGRIAASLRGKGTPIPTNDIWIAAHALQSGADLLSFDHHFAAVDGLVWIRP
jgi:tRNA(fMet)-specific endonuclease VapC